RRASRGREPPDSWMRRESGGLRPRLAGSLLLALRREALGRIRAAVAVAQLDAAGPHPLQDGGLRRVVREVAELLRIVVEVVEELVGRNLLEVARVDVARAADAFPLRNVRVGEQVLAEEVGPPTRGRLAAHQRDQA